MQPTGNDLLKLLNSTDEIPIAFSKDSKAGIQFAKDLEEFLTDIKLASGLPDGKVRTPFSAQQAARIAKVMKVSPPEARMAIWAALNSNISVLFQVHPLAEMDMVAAARAMMGEK